MQEVNNKSGDLPKDLELADDSYDELSTEERIKIAKEIEISAVEQSDQIISAKGSFFDSKSSAVKVLSNGFEGTTESTFFGISASVTARDEDARPEDWDWYGDRFFNKLPPVDEIGKSAADRALRKIGQQRWVRHAAPCQGFWQGQIAHRLGLNRRDRDLTEGWARRGTDRRDHTAGREHGLLSGSIDRQRANKMGLKQHAQRMRRSQLPLSRHDDRLQPHVCFGMVIIHR